MELSDGAITGFWGLAEAESRYAPEHTAPVPAACSAVSLAVNLILLGAISNLLIQQFLNYCTELVNIIVLILASKRKVG